MDDKTKKLKALIKNATPKETFGTDPNDPWSAKAGITESDSMLNAYLRSRGINPNFISKETKISHAKSSAFLKWQHDHQFESITVKHTPTELRQHILKKSAHMHKEIPSNGLHKEESVNEVSSELLDRYKEKAKKSAEALTAKGQHKQSTDRWANIMKATGKQIEKTTANIRKALRKEEVEQVNEMDYGNDDNSPPYDGHGYPKGGKPKGPDIYVKKAQKVKDVMKDAKKTLDKILGHQKEEVEFDEAWNQPDYSQSIKARQAAADKKNTVTIHAPGNPLHGKKGEVFYKHDDGRVNVQIRHSQKKGDVTNLTLHPHQFKMNEENCDCEKEQKKSAWTKVAQARSEIWRRKQIKVDEEQLDELKKSTLASYVKKAHKDATYHSNAAGFVAGVKQPKYNTSDDTPQEKKREKGIERALDKLTKEDTYQDTYAATQTVFDGGNNPDDTEIKKRELSKSARIIKSIYKRKGVVKEDTYDWEKEDKSVESYGKKPKMVTDKKDSFGDNKPEAAIVMKGGKTLTGVERDMIEIDPLLKTRPNQVMNQVVNTSKK